MAQTTDGLLSFLSNPAGYNLAQLLVGGSRVRRALSDDYIRARPGDRILDIGCGTGELLERLPRVDYLGFDLSPAYIAAATEKFGGRGHFVCGDVNNAPPDAVGPFDVIVACAVLHHLEDSEVLKLLRLAAARLAPAGRFVTLDGCLRAGQSAVARWLIKLDRGCNVRNQSGYLGLARQVFPEVQSFLREDLLHVPYTHLILRCSKA